MANTNFLLCLFMATLFLFTILLHPVESSIIAPRRTLAMSPAATLAQFLSAHNKVRAKHSLPPLTWSNNLAKYAKWYAKKRKGDCKLIHSVLKYGENIFWGMGTRWKPSDAVSAWSVQESYYNYKTNTCMRNKECLHYTQLVWKKTSKVGCAKIKCNTGDTLIICEYDPHGNVIGQRPY